MLVKGEGRSEGRNGRGWNAGREAKRKEEEGRGRKGGRDQCESVELKGGKEVVTIEVKED